MSGIYVYSDQLDIAAELIGFAKASGPEVHAVCFSQVDADQLASRGADR